MRCALLPIGMWLLAGCGPSVDRSSEADWSGIPNAYATHFELQVRGEDRRLVVFGPQGRKDTVGIYPFRGPGAEPALQGLERIVVLSTTHLSYFSALGAQGLVVGTAHTDQVRDPRSVAAIRAGTMQEVARADGVDRERLIALDPQVVFDYPFGKGDRNSASVARTVNVGEYLEAHPLGRAEWLRFFGMLLNTEEKADSLFNAIVHRYTFLCDLRTHLQGAPSVLFGSHWDGAWYAPAGNSYMATLIKDAGGSYVFSDSVSAGNINLSLERLLVLGDTVARFGVLLAHDGPVNRSLLVGGDPRIAQLNGVRHGAFVGNSATHDLFGQALLEPDVVLRDLRCIIHPSTCVGHSGTYFQKLAQ